MTPDMTPEAARDFRLQLQVARERALKDAEAFDGIIHVVERLGSWAKAIQTGRSRAIILRTQWDILCPMLRKAALSVVPSGSLA